MVHNFYSFYRYFWSFTIILPNTTGLARNPETFLVNSTLSPPNTSRQVLYPFQRHSVVNGIQKTGVKTYSIVQSSRTTA